MLFRPLTHARVARNSRILWGNLPPRNESEKKCNGFSFVIIKRRWRGNRRKKSVTDTDSGMQQEHSRKSMFSSEGEGEGEREGAATADDDDDFPLRFSVSELALRSHDLGQK